MNDLEEKIVHTYGHKLRVRVCGICIEYGKLLLVRHQGLGTSGSLWTPPGGGMQYGESAPEALKREFMEETGLQIEVLRFLFVHEYLDPPLHGIELFFEVKKVGGTVKTGYDPEMEEESQLITETAFKDLEEMKMEAPETLHAVLQNFNDLKAILNQQGYFKFH